MFKIPRVPGRSANKLAMSEVLLAAFEVWPHKTTPAGAVSLVSSGVDDASALRTWLDSCRRFKSLHTARSYEKEAMRFRMWLTWVTGNEGPRLLADVRAEMVNHYLDYLGAPTPLPASLLARYGKAKQPFNGPLKASSVRQALVILGNMYERFRELDDGDGQPYVRFNPFAMVRGAATSVAKQSVMAPVELPVSRALPVHLWELVDRYLDLAVAEHPDNAMVHRDRWILRLLYHSWLRRQEAASLKMGSFQTVKGKWRLWLIGKGGQAQDIVATARLMAALREYREFRKLPPYPAPGEDRPAIDSFRGSAHVSAQTVYRVVKDVLEHVAVTVEREDPESAALLRSAAPHWMRHTGITHAADGGVDVKNTSKQARHSDIRTTIKNYYHPDDSVAREQLDSIGVGD